MSVTPEVQWAQRSSADDASKNVVFLTVIIPDSKDPKVDLSSTGLSIESDTAEGKKYSVKIDFFDEIDVDESKKAVTGRGLSFILRKKKAQEEYWPRLTKEKAKYHFIKTDFDRWVDEDEQNEVAESDLDPMGGLGGMDFSQMGGGMPGMPDMAGLDGMDFSKLAGGAGLEGLGANGLDDLAGSLEGNDGDADAAADEEATPADNEESAK
ncbi:hypothetical protein CANCADRAFT_131263 [Tortispora caseinolytica NRRL Y-17796]|uniref:CS domain-containing protein n=1 Tax=Tortispora caseinolytica NRRL Y-17796 TaxID=767744 RepID=A0A1E4TB36_9ASCO|nr:hypothetical protein CANCADRAFT_131263 [Tortispora caseinolytica NRRL Y-17796]